MTWLQLIAVSVLANAALANGPSGRQPFEVDLDCSGTFAAGDDVPFVVGLVEQASRSYPVDVTVTVTTPGLGTTEVFATTVALSPRREVSVSRDLGLPSNAPPGDYVLDVVAVGSKVTLSAGCAFVVE